MISSVLTRYWGTPQATVRIDNLSSLLRCQTVTLLHNKMNMMSFRCFAIGLLAAHFLCVPASADESVITINGIRNPELKPYAVMLAGLDAFDDYHALAPKAAGLRFRLRARSAAAGGRALDDVTLRIADDQTSVPVPLTSEGFFSLPRIPGLAPEKADLILNQRKSLYRWEAEVRSAGLPPDTARLGDLRLECEVMVAVAKKEMSIWLHATITSLTMTNHWCGWDKLNWVSHSPRPLRAATLVTPDQRIALKLGDSGTSFTSPTSDKNYPDDALIELDYVDGAVAP